MAGVAALVALVVVGLAYRQFLESGLKRRVGDSPKAEEELRELFVAKVARLGWNLVDDDNPMVAQSSLMGGRRQQISLELKRTDAGTHYEIYPSRFWRKGLIGTPYKAHTLRIRMNSFVAAAGASSSSTAHGGGDWDTAAPAAALAPRAPTVRANGVAPLAARFAEEQTMDAYTDLVASLVELNGDAMSVELSNAVAQFEAALRARASREHVFASARRIAEAASA